MDAKNGRTRSCYSVTPKTVTLILTLLIAFGLAIAAAAASPTQITLAWDKSPEADVAGYRVYFGTASNVYDGFIDAGNATTYVFPALDASKVYYFTVTAYDAEGGESAFSEELSYDASSGRLLGAAWQGTEFSSMLGSLAPGTEALGVETGLFVSEFSACFGASSAAIPKAAGSRQNPWVEVTFADDMDEAKGLANGMGMLVSLSQTDGGEMSVYLGTLSGSSTYFLLLSDSTSGSQEVVILGSRAKGAHSLVVGSGAGGAVDLWFDGALVRSTAGGRTDSASFTSIILLAESRDCGEKVFFSQYRTGWDYIGK